MAYHRTITPVLAVAAAAALGATLTASAATLPTFTPPSTSDDLVIERGDADLRAALEAVTVEVKAVNGSGCKPGTAKASVSADDKTVNVSYNSFAAITGRGVDPEDFRKNCQLGLQLNIPAGYTYAVNTLRHQGFVALLGAGQKATLTTNAYFAGDSDNATRTTTWNAKVNKAIDVKHTIPQASLVWAPCGTQRLLNVNTSVRVDKGSNPNDFGVIALDSSKAKSQTYLHLSWKRC